MTHGCFRRALAGKSLDVPPALYRAFAAVAVPLLTEAIRMQLDAGADIVMVLDTAAGEVPPSCFSGAIGPDNVRLFVREVREAFLR